jgi:hypothetical protein
MSPGLKPGLGTILKDARFKVGTRLDTLQRRAERALRRDQA